MCEKYNLLFSFSTFPLLWGGLACARSFVGLSACNIAFVGLFSVELVRNSGTSCQSANLVHYRVYTTTGTRGARATITHTHAQAQRRRSSTRSHSSITQYSALPLYFLFYFPWREKQRILVTHHAPHQIHKAHNAAHKHATPPFLCMPCTHSNTHSHHVDTAPKSPI